MYATIFGSVMYVTNQSSHHANFFLWYGLFDHTQQTGVYHQIQYPSGWDWFWMVLLVLFLFTIIGTVISEVFHGQQTKPAR